MAANTEWIEDDMTGMDAEGGAAEILAGLWRRKSIILCIGAIGMALGYLFYLKQTPIYQSSAQLLLIKTETKLPIDSARGEISYEDALSTHMLLLRSPLIVGRAVKLRQLDQLPSFAGRGDPTAAISAGLRVTRGGGREAPDPNVMDVTYECLDPKDCATVLDAVIASYQAFLGETYQNVGDETLKLITTAKEELHKQLTEKETAYREFRQKSPLLWVGRDGGNLHETRMIEIEKARSEVIVANAQTKARIDAIQAALAKGGNQEALKVLIGESLSAAKRTTDSLPGGEPKEGDDMLFTSLLEEQMLLEKYGPDHPQVKAVRKRLEMMRERAGAKPVEASADKPLDYVAVYVDSMKHELEIGEKRLAEFTTLFDKEREAAKLLAADQVTDETLRAEIARTQQLFAGVIKRLDEISLVRNYGGMSTQVLSAPRFGAQIAPNLRIILVVAGVFAMLAGVGLAYVVEVADKRFRGPDEIRRQLGLPIVGHIPTIEPERQPARRGANGAEEAPQMDPVLCTFYKPKGVFAESYRAVRTALYFGTRGEGHKVIQITSPDPGDGKTTLAANLAVSMAQSGKRILLIEADFRLPRFVKCFGLKNGPGVSSVIAGECTVAEGTQPTAVENLWAMPCGPRPHNPSELLTSPRFQELLEEVRGEYDFVLVDTPPLLAVTDASVVAARVDTVLLVIRLTKNARQAATRATEILQALDASVMGVVVNGVGKSSRSGYNGYRYGHGSKYGYGYTYSQNGYYADDADEELVGHNHVRKVAR